MAEAGDISVVARSNAREAGAASILRTLSFVVATVHFFRQYSVYIHKAMARCELAARMKNRRIRSAMKPLEAKGQSKKKIGLQS